MRAVTGNDKIRVVRALLLAPPAMRGRLCCEIIHRAQAADRYVRRLGLPHPDWGIGTLHSATEGLPKADWPAPVTADFRNCQLLLAACLARKNAV